MGVPETKLGNNPPPTTHTHKGGRRRREGGLGLGCRKGRRRGRGKAEARRGAGGRDRQGSAPELQIPRNPHAPGPLSPLPAASHTPSPSLRSQDPLAPFLSSHRLWTPAPSCFPTPRTPSSPATAASSGEQDSTPRPHSLEAAIPETPLPGPHPQPPQPMAPELPGRLPLAVFPAGDRGAVSSYHSPCHPGDHTPRDGRTALLTTASPGSKRRWASRQSLQNRRTAQ